MIVKISLVWPRQKEGRSERRGADNPWRGLRTFEIDLRQYERVLPAQLPIISKFLATFSLAPLTLHSPLSFPVKTGPLLPFKATNSATQTHVSTALVYECVCVLNNQSDTSVLELGSGGDILVLVSGSPNVWQPRRRGDLKPKQETEVKWCQETK